MENETETLVFPGKGEQGLWLKSHPAVTARHGCDSASIMCVRLAVLGP